MTKSDQQRIAIINALKSRKNIIDLDILNGVENENDLENITIKFESYKIGRAHV